MTHQTSVKPESPGFVYILTSASMPGQIRIGHTHKNPAACIPEIVDAYGPEMLVELEFYKRFTNAPLAQIQLVSDLAARGAKDASTSAFFECEPQTAVTSLERAGAISIAALPDQDYDALTSQAEVLLALENPSVADLNQALVMLEASIEQGGPLAGYLAARTALALAARKAGHSLQETALEKRAANHLEKSAESGVARAWADLALLRHCQRNENAAKGCWALYFEAFPDREPPLQEMQYLAELLHVHYFSKGANSPSLTFLKHNKIVVKAGMTFYPTDYEYLNWLRTYAWTKTDFMIERARIPVLALSGLALLGWARPNWAITLFSCFAIYYFFLKGKRTKINKI